MAGVSFLEALIDFGSRFFGRLSFPSFPGLELHMSMFPINCQELIAARSRQKGNLLREKCKKQVRH